jgi:integral membrane protein (TIGR01906 family)
MEENKQIQTDTYAKQLLITSWRFYLIIAVPLLLTLFSVRILMFPAFVQLEYSRPGFPDDIYGFTQEERTEYALYTAKYLFNDRGIEYLGDLLSANGHPLYSDGELKHMEDVKALTGMVFGILPLYALTVIIVLVLLWRGEQTKSHIHRALSNGSILTLSIIGAIVISMTVAWDSLFTIFHQLFFDSGTWRFAYSDTLIRLFPEQLWVDAALTVGIFTSIGATTMLILLRFYVNKKQQNSQMVN